MKRSILTVACIFAVATHGLAQTTAIPSMAELQQVALKHPTPPYPRTARLKHVTGAGLFDIRVDASSGTVTDVTAAQSTGSAILDQAAIDTLKRWVFRPNSVVRVKVPIGFTFH